MTTVVIPWREQPCRVRAFRRVMKFWESLGLPVILSDSDPGKPFNRPQARNRGVEQASGVVVLCDADTLPSEECVVEAVDSVAGEVIYPFTVWHYVNGELVDAPWNELLGADAEFYWPDMDPGTAVGSPMVCRADTYWRLGGQDDRFSTWGGEDYAFSLAAATLTGARRIPGTAVSFSHPVDGGRKDDPDVAWLRELYVAADGDPPAMEALVADRAVGVDYWKSHYPSPPSGRHWI